MSRMRAGACSGPSLLIAVEFKFILRHMQSLMKEWNHFPYLISSNLLCLFLENRYVYQIIYSALCRTLNRNRFPSWIDSGQWKLKLIRKIGKFDTKLREKYWLKWNEERRRSVSFGCSWFRSAALALLGRRCSRTSGLFRQAWRCK